MSAIHDLPTDKNYGLGFNYSVWTQGTAITLANVPWNSDYRDVVRFDNQAALDTYLKNNAGPVIDIPKVSYAKFGRPIRLDTPFHTVQNFNYLRAYNPAQPIAGDTARAFYYFIVDVVYVNPNCTEIFVQLDVWQTFGYGITFGNSYIQQGHIGIANENAFDDFGREFLTVPEGLDVGGEYRMKEQWTRDIATARDLSTPESDPELGPITSYDIMVVTTVSFLSTDFGTVDDPKMSSAKGSKMENLPNGSEIWIFATSQFQNFLEAFSDKPYITSGIISITAIPPAYMYNIPTTNIQIEDGVFALRVGERSLNRVTSPLANNWRDAIDLPDRYQHLKKFWTYPYMVLELTCYNGAPLMLKPESWADDDLTVIEVPHFAPPSPRLAFYPYRYNAGDVASVSDKHGVLNDGGEFLDSMTAIFNFPQFSILNNGYLTYMASNNASIGYQHSSADWGQQKSQTGATVAYNQASSGINTSKDVNRIGINASQRQAQLSNETAGYNAIKGGVNNALGANALGLANTIADYAIGTNQTSMSNSISTGSALATNRAETSNSSYARDSNLDYASFANQGDYENAIAGIQAKIQDAKLIQPTTSGQMGGDAFNLASYKWGYDVKLKMVGGAAMNQVGEFWLRYGYAVNRFGKMPASFMVMEKFTYWKLKETYITGSSCPETFKQAIRGIFEKGVTVWKNPNDIGNIDIADNAPLTGVTI